MVQRIFIVTILSLSTLKCASTGDAQQGDDLTQSNGDQNQEEGESEDIQNESQNQESQEQEQNEQNQGNNFENENLNNENLGGDENFNNEDFGGDDLGGEDINSDISNEFESNGFLQANQGDFFGSETESQEGEISNTPQSFPTTGGMVKYVLDSTSLYDQPQGSSVRSLEKGDHPLIVQEGDWDKTSDGLYISNQELTRKPVARIRARSAWIE